MGSADSRRIDIIAHEGHNGAFAAVLAPEALDAYRSALIAGMQVWMAEIGKAAFAMIAGRTLKYARVSDASVAVHTAAGAEVSARVARSLAPFAKSQS